MTAPAPFLHKGGEMLLPLASFGSIYTKVWPGAEDKAPLLLLHDSLGCVALWRDFPQELNVATGRTVIAYDRPGFGRSPRRTDRLPVSFVEDEAALVVALCDALGLSTVVLLGHSVGGGMALAGAAALGERCVAVITMAAQAFVEERTRRGIEAAKVVFSDPAQREKLSRYHDDKTDWVLAAWIDTWLGEPFRDWNLDRVLASLQRPLLCLHGDADEYGSVAHPQRLCDKAAAEASLVIFPGGGHFPHRESEARVVAAIARFIEKRA
ncbi:MAG: alpha/beta fold hydrolase [Alcanivorax sp.]